MKNTHDMTRLELELEVTELREKVVMLKGKVNQLQSVLNIYGEYIDKMGYEHPERKLVKKNERR